MTSPDGSRGSRRSGRAAVNLALVAGLLLVSSAVDDEAATRAADPAAAEERAATADDAAAEAPAEEDEEGVIRRPTADGDAAVKLTVEPEEIAAGETVTFRLANRGDVPLVVELDFGLDRREGDGWARKFPPRSGGNVSDVPGLEVLLPPGATTEPEAWPVAPWPAAEPGRYRILKTVRYDGSGEDVQIVAHDDFEVTE